jgi:NADH-quinone oxidoreductase subunit L
LLMTLPLLILAVPSAIIGWFCKGFFLGQVRPWSAGLAASEGDHHGGAEWLPIVATLLALGGVAISWYWYAKKKNPPGFPGRAAPIWYRLLSDKFYIDELYLFLAKGVAAKWIAAPTAWVERRIVNGSFDWAAGALKRLAFAQSLFHSGQVQLYIAVALLGLGAVAFFGGMGF